MLSVPIVKPPFFGFAQNVGPLSRSRPWKRAPEAVKAAGAKGVMLNHAEKPIAMDVLEAAIRRAEPLAKDSTSNQNKNYIKGEHMMLITNAKLVLETDVMENGAVLVQDGRIQKIGSTDDFADYKGEVLDAAGAFVGPGFVDVHVHGGDGVFFYQDPARAARHFLSHGETTLCPTLYYDLTREDFLHAIALVQKEMQGENGAVIAGIYMEGPYMNPGYGACPELNKWRGEIKKEEYAAIVDAAGKDALVWAVAPEREGIEEFMAYAKSVNPNTRFSVGHSEATPEQIERVKKYGISGVTHCMNATGQKSEWIGVRGAGPDEACMLDDEMYAEIISDSLAIHVNPDLQKLLLKVKGEDRIILISDSNVSAEPNPVGWEHILDLCFDRNGILDGSLLTMDIVLKNFMKHTGATLTQAFKATSLNGARMIGLDNEVGSIAEGKRANFVFLDDEYNLKSVMLDGATVQ